VANREWALPSWFENLAKQTRKPYMGLMIHGGKRFDATWQAIEDGAHDSGIQTIRIHEGSPPHDRNCPPDENGRREPDQARYFTLARLRNQMLAAATIMTDATHVLSLDSDIMLEDPSTIEYLLEAPAMIEGLPGCPDVVAPLTHFHPNADWTCNAGLLGNRDHHPREAIEAGRPEDLGYWPWKRAEPDPEIVELGAIQEIDIPMGAILMPRRVFSTVRYRWHQSGEDIGFGINLKLAGFTAGWIPHLYARHCWDRYAL
jgi:hypothetical protein